MSGIYLVVWDPVARHESRVLKATRGGYPHITVAYTKNHLSWDALVRTAGRFMVYAGANVRLTISHATVNSFQDKPDHTRHDVLLMLDEKSAASVETMRGLLHTLDDWEKLVMRTPHVTHGTYETEAEAQAAAALLNEQLLPLEVVITGVTVE